MWVQWLPYADCRALKLFEYDDNPIRSELEIDWMIERFGAVEAEFDAACRWGVLVC